MKQLSVKNTNTLSKSRKFAGDILRAFQNITFFIYQISISPASYYLRFKQTFYLPIVIYYFYEKSV